MKKILLIFLLTYVGISFSQEAEKLVMDSVVIDQVNAYPNPFKNKTTIFFNAKQNETVTVSVQNILGKIVFTEKIVAKAGRNSIDFYKNKLSGGIYVYTVATKSNKISKRLVIK
jgi:hypothetical protein